MKWIGRLSDLMKKFWTQVNNAVIGGLSAFIMFILGFIWWLFEPHTLVPMWVLSLTIIACYLICVIVYGLCSIKKDSTVYRLPAVRSIQQSNNKLIFIVERNDLFNQGSYATICYQDNEESLELIIGLGYVESINSAGNLQVVIERLSSAESAKKIYDNIKNTSFYRKAIIIKPSIDKKILEEVIANG